VEELARFAQLVAEKLTGRVLLVSVFGSRVKGKAGPLSDVDVAVLPASRSLDEKLLLACDLAALASEAFGVPDDRVDIAFLDDAPQWLLFEALARGVVVYCADRELLASLRLKAVSEYLDFEVFKRKLNLTERYLEAVKRGVKDG
jgi:predicted nucleotidyltransferase